MVDGLPKTLVLQDLGASTWNIVCWGGRRHDQGLKIYLLYNGLPFSGLQAYLTPVDAFESSWVRFRDNACCVTNTMFVHELLINIG